MLVCSVLRRKYLQASKVYSTSWCNVRYNDSAAVWQCWCWFLNTHTHTHTDDKRHCSMGENYLWSVLCILTCSRIMCILCTFMWLITGLKHGIKQSQKWVIEMCGLPIYHPSVSILLFTSVPIRILCCNFSFSAVPVLLYM